MKAKRVEKEKRKNEEKNNSILVFGIASSYFILWCAMNYFTKNYELAQLAFITHVLSVISLFAIIFAIIHFILTVVMIQQE